MGMTLDEAIKHCEEVAEKNDKIADTFEETLKNKITCRECAKEHRQLAEWLKELKAYKDERVGCEYCKHNYRGLYERPCSLCKRSFMDMFERKVDADEN